MDIRTYAFLLSFNGFSEKVTWLHCKGLQLESREKRDKHEAMTLALKSYPQGLTSSDKTSVLSDRLVVWPAVLAKLLLPCSNNSMGQLKNEKA